jgi:hypothetical protein
MIRMKFYDMLQANYDMIQLLSSATISMDKIHNVVEAERKLNMCPCPCCGYKTHTIPETNHFLKEKSMIVKHVNGLAS